MQGNELESPDQVLILGHRRIRHFNTWLGTVRTCTVFDINGRVFALRPMYESVAAEQGNRLDDVHSHAAARRNLRSHRVKEKADRWPQTTTALFRT